VALRVEEDGEPGSLAFLGGPAVIGAPEAPPRRVVVLAVDTLRPDHLGAHGYARDTSPELDALAARSVVFERAWAPAPRTRPSFRSATTGRGALDAVGAPTLGEVFAAEGFATAGIVANIHLNHRFGFDRGYDWWRLDTAARAGDQVDAALAWLGANAHRDTFLFLHIMDPHLFYDPPPPYDTAFVAAPDPTLPPSFNRWGVLGWIARDEVTEARAAHVTGLYDGEIAYTSAQIGRLVEGIDALPGTTALVFHTDHGEELFEHGGFEHNHALWEEVVRAALWIRLPPPHEATALRSEEPVALWDIAPTLYELAGVGSPPPSDGRSLLPLALGADPGGWDRPLPIGHLMYDVEQWGVVWRGHKYAIETTSGRERLYDLAADPGERVDLAAGADLAPFREALGRAHGMPVGPGWRIAIDLRGQEPLE
jgi:arylsulfatase A-like enzyme